MDTKQKEECTIQYKTLNIEPDECLVSPQGYDSWITLLEVAEVRNHKLILEIAKNTKEHEVPLVFYHRKCTSMFTMKRDLESLKRKADSSVEALCTETGGITRQKRKVSLDSRVYDEECIFCGKEKYIHGENSRERLVKATQLRVDGTLGEKALSKRNEKILAVTSRDIIAAEEHYHQSCYKDYTRENSPKGKFTITGWSRV